MPVTGLISGNQGRLFKTGCDVCQMVVFCMQIVLSGGLFYAVRSMISQQRKSLRMISRRDWCLQQLGVTRWTLRNPAALHGEVAIKLPDNVRLVVVAQPPLVADDPLIADVLRALQLVAEQMLTLSYQQVAMLVQSRPCNSWWLGVQAQALPGRQLVSPDLTILRRSAAARAELWQQIYQHEHDFFPQPL